MKLSFDEIVKQLEENYGWEDLLALRHIHRDLIEDVATICEPSGVDAVVSTDEADIVELLNNRTELIETEELQIDQSIEKVQNFVIRDHEFPEIAKEIVKLLKAEVVQNGDVKKQEKCNCERCGGWSPERYYEE